MQKDLNGLEHGTERAAELEAAAGRAAAEYSRCAALLTAKRPQPHRCFARTLERSLADLAMARTRCDVRFTAAESDADWTERGMEQAELYISPNPGEDLKPLARIASGGELSRIMLALKTLGSTDAPGKTLIFDEVDTGIGGAWPTSSACGCRPGEDVPGALHHASAADRRLRRDAPHITKSVKQGRTLTRVEQLAADARHEELARMIGGSDVSAVVRASAREMLASRKDGRAKGE